MLFPSHAAIHIPCLHYSPTEKQPYARAQAELQTHNV